MQKCRMNCNIKFHIKKRQKFKIKTIKNEVKFNSNGTHQNHNIKFHLIKNKKIKLNLK